MLSYSKTVCCVVLWPVDDDCRLMCSAGPHCHREKKASKAKARARLLCVCAQETSCRQKRRPGLVLFLPLPALAMHSTSCCCCRCTRFSLSWYVSQKAKKKQFYFSKNIFSTVKNSRVQYPPRLKKPDGQTCSLSLYNM